MAKFTADTDLNIRWQGHDIVGAAGATHRITDALYDEFVAEVIPNIPGTVTWISTDESGGAIIHGSLLSVTANQHHNQVHSISGADHTGTLAHSALASVGANDHHAQVHSISGADHTGTLAHSALASVGADDHHARSHDHSNASDGSTLRPGTILIPTASVSITARSTFPSSPTADDICYRTDLNILFFYDGTRWLTEDLSTEVFHGSGTLHTGNGTASRLPLDPGARFTNFFVYTVELLFIVVGGTALSGSHKWDLTVSSQPNGTTIGSPVSINSGASDTWRTDIITHNALISPTTDTHLQLDLTKTGTPGSLVVYPRVYYRATV